MNKNTVDYTPDFLKHKFVQLVYVVKLVCKISSKIMTLLHFCILLQFLKFKITNFYQFSSFQTTSVVHGVVDVELCVFLPGSLCGQVILYLPTLKGRRNGFISKFYFLIFLYKMVYLRI